MRRQRSYEVASANKRGAEHFAQSLTSRRNGFSQRISPSSNHNQYPFREFGRFHHSKIRQVKSAILLCGWLTKRRFYPRLSSDQESRLRPAAARRVPAWGSLVDRGDAALEGRAHGPVVGQALHGVGIEILPRLADLLRVNAEPLVPVGEQLRLPLLCARADLRVQKKA